MSRYTFIATAMALTLIVGSTASAQGLSCEDIFICADACADSVCAQTCLDAGTPAAQAAALGLDACMENAGCYYAPDQASFEQCAQHACYSDLEACFAPAAQSQPDVVTSDNSGSGLDTSTEGDGSEEPIVIQCATGGFASPSPGPLLWTLLLAFPFAYRYLRG